MSGEEANEAEVTYDVVINEEEQYSIWRTGREIPEGWRAAGFQGRKSDCLEHIEKVWTDMRPKSLRDQMAARDQASVSK
ncbi:MAG TPA: MbtH family NRPS accessory protein [Streptosporangiaceae bacterium]|nr:MbtH family NRPS accessory protein [Streptosporangiaceae bacterium]